jgi:hypothetical protein
VTSLTANKHRREKVQQGTLKAGDEEIVLQVKMINREHSNQRYESTTGNNYCRVKT